MCLRYVYPTFLLSFWACQKTGTQIVFRLNVAATEPSLTFHLAIQEKLPNYDAGGGILLTLHIAIGAGNLYTFHLGGINHSWEFFPAGVFAQIGNALDKSKSGPSLFSLP